MTEFTGIKQPEFDTMATRHAEAARRLTELAQALHHELTSVGLDPAPATRLRRLAARATAQAEDLRRRQRLVHELQRQKITFGRCTPAGSFLEMPDSLEAAQGLLDGTLTGRAAARAANGDATAVAELEQHTSQTGNPDFVKAFLDTLGARGVTRLPGSLAALLRNARSHGHTERLTRLSAQSKKALRLLSAALAKGTDPQDPAYPGDDFLHALAKEGRAQHASGDVDYAGYQAQALIWRAHDGAPPFSQRFMEVVGRDVIRYEHEQRQDQWSAGKDALGSAFGGVQLPLIDLAGALGLGTMLRPDAQLAAPGTRNQSSIVEDLFHAAKSSREASHALLNHTPAGWKKSILDYLLTTRWNATRYLGDYQPIRNLLTTATTGQDTTSKKLAAEMIKILSKVAESAIGKAGFGILEIRNKEAFDRFAPLRYTLGRAIAANINQVSHLILNHEKFGEVAAKDMVNALALACSDDVAFDVLVRAQIEHMRSALETAPPLGLNDANAEWLGFTKTDVKKFDLNGNGEVDKSDIIQALKDRAVAEARPFTHIVETRRQVLIAQGLNDQKADESLKTMVSNALGLLPVPGAKQVSSLAAGAFGEILEKGYEKLGETAYDQMAKQVAQRMFEQRRSLDETHRTLADNRLATERLADQMLATALLNKGTLDELSLKNQSFALENPPRIKSFAEMTPQEYSQFIAWARESGGSNEVLNLFSLTFRNTGEVYDYLGIGSSSTGDGK